MPKYDYTIQRRASGAYFTRARVAGRSRMFSGATEREVHAAIAAARTDEARGTYIDTRDARITLREYAEAWRVHYPARWSTGELIRTSLQLHWYPLIGDVALAKLRPSLIQSAVTDLSTRLAPLTLSEKTVPHLRLVLNAAVADRLIPSSPLVGVRLPRVERSEIAIPTTAEVAAVLDAIDGRSRALVAVGAGLGLRQGEALGLSVDRVDFLRRAVKIDRQRVRTAGGSALGPLKTARSYRTVPLPETVAVELAAHVGAYPSADPDGLLFAPLHEVRRVWTAATMDAGVPSLTFHGLRHFYASALIRAGHSPTAVAARLGNSAAMVLGTYAHLWPDDDDRTRDAVDDLFGSLRVPSAHLGA